MERTEREVRRQGGDGGLMIFYVISIIFAVMATLTNNLGQLIAALIIAGVATIVDRVGR